MRPEERDNEDIYVKGVVFPLDRDYGSHNLIFGYDRFNDRRFANNHQSGSDYRILGTSSIIRGTDDLPGVLSAVTGTTIIQWNPISDPARARTSGPTRSSSTTTGASTSG